VAAERIRLVVLFGGCSAEHDVSCTSAVSVLAAADRSRYEIVPVGVTRQGVWVEVDPAPVAGTPKLEAAGNPVDPFEAVSGAVVFPLIHGPFGEDGTLQGLCEQAGVPYLGCGVLSSAVCMDKIVTKRLLSEAGIASARHIGLRSPGAGTDLVDRVGSELGWPLFVKPANLGSSIGVSKVAGPDGLPAAIEAALGFDEWVIVEETIAGREIECGVLGVLGAPGDGEASVPGEVRPGREFYDYDDKYLDGQAEIVVPADLSFEVRAGVRELAVATFAALRCEGMARVDFFLEEGGRLLVNEVNTIPGFTPISMFPKMWEASGLAYPALIDRLVDLARERHSRRSRPPV